MKIDFLADTNFFIYIFEGNPNIENFLDYNFGISFISEIELLGYHNLTSNDEELLKSIINDCYYFDFNNHIKNKTIELRKKVRIKLPDALIAATAIVNNLPLITADKGFEIIEQLDLILIDF